MGSDNFMGASGSPHILKINDKDYTLPRLTLRNMGVLASKIKSVQLERLKSLINDEGLEADKKARFLSLTKIRDYNIDDVREWAWSIDGGMEIVKTALSQKYTPTEASEIVEAIADPEKLLEAALETTFHPMAPSAVAKRKFDEEAAKNKDEPEKK